MLSTEPFERTVIDALPIAIFSLDADGRLTSDEARGRPMWEAHAGFAREQVEYAMRALRTGRATVVRWEIVDASDTHQVSVASMTPMHDDTHAVTGFVVAVSDLTHSVRGRDLAYDAALKLALILDPDRVYQEAANQLRQAVRADLVVIARADDNASSVRAVYESGSDVDRRALEQRFAEAWRSALDEGRILTSRIGSSLELSAPLGIGHEPFGVLTVVIDDVDSPEHVAEATRFIGSVAENVAVALERARQVEHEAQRRRGDAIGQVAAGVAHELRNPIFGISSAAQLLRFRAREDPVVEKNVGRVLREVERLNRMVSTLLELARPVALNRTQGDPDTVWDEVLIAERGLLESRSVVVRRTRAESPPMIAIDAQQLAQAFTSIVSNAINAAPEATDLSLQSAVLASGIWRCRLTNKGVPIPTDILPRVFEPFLSTKPGSPGVGLALARRVIEEHGGSIAINSSTEEGTTVTITLPPSPS